MRAAWAVAITFIVLAGVPPATSAGGEGHAHSLLLAGVDLSTIRGSEARFLCDGSWGATLGTAARWSSESGAVDPLGSGLSQDPGRVTCDFINHLTLDPRTAFTIVAQLECLPADRGSTPPIRATVLVTFVVEPDTGAIRPGMFIAVIDAGVEPAVV